MVMTANEIADVLTDIRKDLKDLDERIDEVLASFDDGLVGDVPPQSDLAVGNVVDFVNMKDNNIEKFQGRVTAVGLKDNEGNWFCRVETEDGRKFRVPCCLEDTRKGTKVLAVYR
jgi:hypothetical protein